MMEFPHTQSAAIASLCIVTALITLTYLAILPKPIPGIPYNKVSASRVLGDAPDIIKYQEQHHEIWSYVRQLAGDLNSPIIQMFMRPFGKPWVIIADARESHDIQMTRKDEFDRSMITGEVFGPIFPENHVSFPIGEAWRSHRQLIKDTISPSFLNGVVAPSIHMNTQDLIAIWRKKAAIARGRPFNGDKDLSRTVVDIIIETTFGIKAEALKVQEQLLHQTVLPASVDEPVDFPAAEDAEAFTSIRDLSDSVQIAMGSPVPTLSLKFALTFKKSLISARKYTDKMINQRLQSAWRKFSGVEEKGTVKSATDLIVQREAQMARKEGRDIKIDTQVIKDELFGFYMAGQETTSTTLCWALKYLTAHPNIQKRLRNALREAHGRAHRNGGLPSVQEIAQADVPYLEAFIQEVHRVGNSVSSIVRVTTKDTVILGHVVPKGTDVFMLTNGPSYKTPPLKIDEAIRSKTSRENKDKFGVWDDETIGKFIPERWLAMNEKGEIFFNPSAGYTHPYGVGPRACFGMKWAQLMLKSIITLVVWSFEFEPLPPAIADFKAIDVTTHRAEFTYIRPVPIQ